MSRHRAAWPLFMIGMIAALPAVDSAQAQFFPRSDETRDGRAIERRAVQDTPDGTTRRAFPAPAVEAPREDGLPWLRRSPVTALERDDRLIFRRIDQETPNRGQSMGRARQPEDDRGSARANEEPRRFGEPERRDRTRRDDRRQRATFNDRDPAEDDAVASSPPGAFPLPNEPSPLPRTARDGSVLPDREDPPVQVDVARLPPVEVQPTPPFGPSADPEVTGSLDQDDTDPTRGIGIDVGSLRFFPAIELRGGGSLDTGASLNNEAGSGFAEIAPELSFESLWTRHSIAGELRGSLTRFEDRAVEDDISVEGRLTGRLDVGARSSLTVEGAYDLDRLSGGEVGVPDNSDDRPFQQTISVEGTFEHRWNRLTARLRGAVTSFLYEDTEDETGTPVDNGGLEHRLDVVGLRLGYEYSPKTEVFIEGELDRDVYDNSDLGSLGQRVQVGAVWRPSALIEFEAAVGAERREPDATGADEVIGLVAEASAIWRPSELTTFTLRGSQDIDITNETGAAAVRVTTAEATLEHELTRFLRFRGGVLYDISDFEGIDREDRRLGLNAGLSYELNRYLLLVADIAHSDIDSTDNDEDSRETEYSAGIRIRY